MRSRSAAGTGPPFCRSSTVSCFSSSPLVTVSPLMRATTLGSWAGTGLINAEVGGGSAAPGGGAGVAGGGAVAAADGAAVPAGLLAVVPLPLFGVEVPLFEQAVTDSATITATGKARSTHILLMMRTARGYIPPLSAYVGDSGWSNVAAVAGDGARRQFRPA